MYGTFGSVSGIVSHFHIEVACMLSVGQKVLVHPYCQMPKTYPVNSYVAVVNKSDK